MTYEEAKEVCREYTKGLVAKWDKTSLLDGLKSDLEHSNMAVLLESKPQRILYEDMSEEERRWAEAMVIVYEHDHGKVQETSEVQSS